MAGSCLPNNMRDDLKWSVLAYHTVYVTSPGFPELDQSFPRVTTVVELVEKGLPMLSQRQLCDSFNEGLHTWSRIILPL